MLWLPLSQALADSNWLANAQLHAAKQNDAAALATLWQGFAQQDLRNQQQAMLLAAELCARNGLLELARSYYLRLIKPSNESPLASGDRFAIARFFADQQEWRRSAEVLEPHWQTFPYQLKQQARNLLALAQLQRGQNAQALSTLQFKRHNSQALPYRRFNLAVSQHRLGKTFEARKALHTLAEQKAHTLEQAMLRDHARVALAKHYLSFSQGRFAAPLLQTIKFNSAYAHSALLLLGWAALTPGGERPRCQQLSNSQGCWIETNAAGHDVQRSNTSISETFSKLRPKPGTKLDSTLLPPLHKAIASWRLLTKKPLVGNTAPQELLAYLEGQVSLAYALHIAGQYPAALQQYKQALAQLTAQQQAPTAFPATHYIGKLQQLHSAFNANAHLPAALQDKTDQAIRNAIGYRQLASTEQQKRAQQQWDKAILEYRKQAHLGLASLHEQMSYQ